MASDDTVYCLCRQTYDGNGFMIECDVCKDWFHGNCVGIQEHQAIDIEIYHCPNCQVEHGPLVLKKRRNWHRHDYSESDESVSRAVQTGTFVFVQELKARSFASPDDMALLRMHGSEMSIDYFEQNGFEIPILVDKKDGLDLKVPPPNFSIQDVELYVGSMREIDVIDVSRQEDVKMLMREWTEYYNSPNRSKILNVISLEFSTTRLAEFVEPPRVVKEMSWVHQLWPENIQDGEEVQFVKPEVQRYCLMGVKDSFTDFHVDFGGTSVWYHVLRGEKVFYLIRPTPANLALYERWISSSAQSETFFGDLVDMCYKCTVKTGQTMFIPTGWIHAVLTPIDSLVFGGNFLHSYNMDLQIQIHEIEKKVKTPEKYLFPNYETVHWYAAKYVYDLIKDANEDKQPIAEHIADGARALAVALKNWTSKKDFCKGDTVPETLQYNKLLKDLNKEVKNLPQRGSMRGKKSDLKKLRKSKKKEDPVQMPYPSKLTMDVQGEGFSKISFGKVDMSPIDKPQMSDLDALLSLQAPGGSTVEHASDPDQTLGGSLKVRIPKAGAYILDQQPKEENKDISVYDFKDDFDDTSNASPTKSPIRSPLAKMLKTPPHTLSTSTLPPSFKLKVSNVTLQGSKLPVTSLVDKPVDRGSSSSGLKTPTTLKTPSSLKSPSAKLPKVKEESDSDGDNLVVDERPPAKKARRDSKGPAGSLKLRLSTKDIEGGGPGGPGAPAGGGGDSDPRSMASPEQRANIPTIRGGLNCSIADILEASGYGTETDFKIDEDMGRASPSMRDAIQGMLSMSRMGGLQLGSDVFDIKPKTPLRTPLEQKLPLKRHSANDEETIDKMPSCYKDEEYVYPTLDLSDSEDEHVFKPRGRIRKDETWNPKAKLSPNCPKPERPQREGVRRESVESGLAAAAARLASQPPPKRQYIRKKPKPLKLEEARPGTSFAVPSSSSVLQIGSKKPTSVTSPTAKKPKKGMATTKQRLSKILKMKF